MTTTSWHPGLALGIEEIDAQHRELFRRVAALDQAIARGTHGEVGRTLEFLQEYAVAHFEAEERVMLERGYPGFAAHRAKHDEFVARVLAITAEHASAGEEARLTVRVRKVLGGWLARHVADEDVRLGRHLAATDARPASRRRRLAGAAAG